ncbi:MAG: glycine cleavage system protein GcvH [Candidatus Zixiibacteriota bacterium]|nr:MAG: glycine cleavage system protein GcvH [candidate division Zixibacteria bacterium]
MDIPAELKYTKEHEWIKVEGDTAVVGITEYAQGELGDIVFVELPAVDTEVKAMDAFGTIEAVKAVSDLFSPVSGKVIEVNTKLEDDPMIINRDPYGDGWMIKLEISNMEEIDSLLTADGYQKLVE